MILEKPKVMSVKFAFLFMILIFIISCMDKEVQKIDDFNEWKIKAKASEAYTPVDELNIEKSTIKKQEEKIPKDIKKEIVVKKKIKKRLLPTMNVSLKMNDVPIDVLIRTLAKVGNINIIISKNVKGKAGLNIESVPWNQVFESILKTFGYSYEWIGDIIRVISIADITNDVGLIKAQQSITLKKREHALTMLTLNSKAEELEPLETIVIPILYIGADDLEPLKNNLLTLLNKSGDVTAITKSAGAESISSGNLSRGGIMIDRHTHSLVIQATASEIAKIIPVIKKLDKPVHQILIEAQIVEATKDTARELGVQWGGLGFRFGHGRNNWLGGPMGDFADSLFTSEDQGSLGDADYIPAGSPVTHIPAPIGNAVNLPINSAGQGMNLGMLFENPGEFMLTVQLQALQKKGKLNILSSPSITTLDNQKATIESGKNIPFQTISDGTVTIQFEKAVISLEVTPHVISNNILKLEIITKKDEIDWTRTVQGNPTLNTKEAKTGVVLFNGQTTVIAGLSKNLTSDGDSGVPFLKDIPVLGNFFKSSDKKNELEELLIFITPRILDAKNFQEVKYQRTQAAEDAKQRLTKQKEDDLKQKNKTPNKDANQMKFKKQDIK